MCSSAGAEQVVWTEIETEESLLLRRKLSLKALFEKFIWWLNYLILAPMIHLLFTKANQTVSIETDYFYKDILKAVSSARESVSNREILFSFFSH